MRCCWKILSASKNPGALHWLASHNKQCNFSSRFALRRAQNRRARNHSRFSLGECHTPRASAVAHARPLCPLAPARHRRFAKVPPGVPFATHARESRRALLECQRANPRGHDVQRFSGAQVSAGKPRRCATRRGNVLCVSRGLVDCASGQLSLRSRAALLLRETVRPHFALQDLIDTLPPSSAHYACR